MSGSNYNFPYPPTSFYPNGYQQWGGWGQQQQYMHGSYMRSPPNFTHGSYAAPLTHSPSSTSSTTSAVSSTKSDTPHTNKSTDSHTNPSTPTRVPPPYPPQSFFRYPFNGNFTTPPPPTSTSSVNSSPGMGHDSASTPRVDMFNRSADNLPNTSVRPPVPGSYMQQQQQPGFFRPYNNYNNRFNNGNRNHNHQGYNNNMRHKGPNGNFQWNNRNFKRPRDQEAIDHKAKSKSKKKKSLSENRDNRKDWTEEDAEKVLAIEREYNKVYKNHSLIIKFPDPDLNKEIVSRFHKDIENVHFQQPSTARFCFVTLSKEADAESVISALNQVKFGEGTLTAEYKKDREEDQIIGPGDIDPLTLYVGNLAQEVTKEDMVTAFPKCKRIDIGYAKKMKYTRYAFVAFRKVDDAIEAFKKTRCTEMHSKSLIVRFRRLKGTVGLPGESKPQNPPKSKDTGEENRDTNNESTITPATPESNGRNSVEDDESMDEEEGDETPIDKDWIRSSYTDEFLKNGETSQAEKSQGVRPFIVKKEPVVKIEDENDDPMDIQNSSTSASTLASTPAPIEEDIKPFQRSVLGPGCPSEMFRNHRPISIKKEKQEENVPPTNNSIFRRSLDPNREVDEFFSTINNFNRNLTRDVNIPLPKTVTVKSEVVNDFDVSNVKVKEEPKDDGEVIWNEISPDSIDGFNVELHEQIFGNVTDTEANHQHKLYT